jgi:hypothetical protein
MGESIMNEAIGVVAAIVLALALPLLAGVIAHFLLWLDSLQPQAARVPHHERFQGLSERST